MNYWFKVFTTTHEGISVAVTELINKQTPIPTWLLEGKCGLYPKKLQPKAPDHRPITYLNKMYKSITSLVGEYINKGRFCFEPIRTFVYIWPINQSHYAI